MVSQISLRAVCGSVALLSQIFFSHICTVCNPKPLNKCRISLGTLFYSYYYQWPLPQSFFYAVDAGMSIGFCTDVAETKVASRAFTIVHILLGASCVGGALVLMVQSALEGVASRSSAVYRLILERDSLKRAFLAGGASDNLPSSMQQAQSFANRNHRSPLTRDDYDANNNKSKSPGPLVTNNFKELSSLMTILTTNDFYWQDLIPRHPRLRRLFSPLERIWRKDARLTQQPLQSKKRQMYLTCFAIVFLW